MAQRRRLLVVSNRGPVSYECDVHGVRVAKRGAGGLVNALRSLVEHHDVMWIASAMTEEDRVVAREGDDHNGVRFVSADERAYNLYYNVVANPTLWFLQHYMWGLPYAPDIDHDLHVAWFEGYVPVNEAFAEAVVAELDRGPAAAVFFHDYHLYLAPRIVRAQRPDVRMSHFVHIPWPQSDYWHVLPAHLRRDVHEGLLANDVVGFHTKRWCANFLQSCADVLGAEVDEDASTVVHDGRRTLVTCHAIGTDPTELAAHATSDAVLEQERSIVERRSEQLLVRVDRTDPSKNVVRGFRAFALCLELHPELQGRVTFLALLDPSRQDVPEYADYLAAIEREAQAVNDRFARDGWLPVDLQVADNFAQSVAAYKQYDALLVNAVFDGLNLVAKEAPLVNERDGVLILSENTGAHEELGDWALTVNPFDVYGQAQAIHAALTMVPGERRSRIEATRAHLREHDIESWIAAQLGDLDRVRP